MLLCDSSEQGDEDMSIALAVIYGQEVLYAARGQDARSRPAQAGIQWFIGYIPAGRE